MKKFLTFILVLAMVLSVSSFAMAANGSIGGNGSEADPFLIEDLDDLKAFRDNVNNGDNYAGKYVKLAASIDMSSVNWTPIGDPQVDNKYNPKDASKVFSGVFDGNDNVLYNLKIEKNVGGADEEANLGLFSIIADDAVVKNLTITNVNINTDGRNVGALAGVTYGSIANITVNGNIQIVGGNNVSGVGGMNRHHAVSASNVTLSGNDGSVIKGNNIVGGIFAEIAPNGKTHTFENLSVENVAITGVGGVGGIVGLLTNGAMSNVSVKNVVLTGKTEYQGDPMGRIRLGSVVGLLGNKGPSTVSGVTVQNVTGKNLNGETVALPDVGANYDASSNATEARIGDDYYATLAIAVDKANDGDTITLLTDASASDVNTNGKNLTIVDKNGVEHAFKGGVSISPATLDFGTKEAGYSSVNPLTVIVKGVEEENKGKPGMLGEEPVKVTLPDEAKNKYTVEIKASGNREYTISICPVDGLGAGNHNTTFTVYVYGGPVGSPAERELTVDALFTVTAPTSSTPSSSGSGYSGPDVWYIGGNTFGTTTNQVPTSVEIDGVPVSFTMNGNQITVGCIQPGSDWVTVRWGSVSNYRSFTPDANAYCTQTVIPKTGDMSFWAAVAQFFGF